MAYCTYTDVKRIITTRLEDADITELIVLADSEITARDLTGLNSDILKRISMYLTADLIQSETAQSVSLGLLSSQKNMPRPDWRLKAETLITKTNAPPIYIGEDTTGYE